MHEGNSLVLDVKKGKHKWNPFKDNQKKFRNELNELASKNIPNAYEDRVYKESHFLGFLGFKKRQEKLNNLEFKN